MVAKVRVSFTGCPSAPGIIKHAMTVATALLSAAASVRVVELPNLPAKGDVTDWREAGATFHGLFLTADIATRVGSIDWERVSTNLDAQGSAMIENLLTPIECDALSMLYPNDDIFRSRVVMGRHGFGRGEYKYFAYPLPPLVGELREALYARLLPVANRWRAALGQGDWPWVRSR